ncbi:MAG: D-alanyl-D-alanine carboxypeptidase (penicillin-binding protein 5/6) [Paracoccaceae bacterium]|jgi:D-alanyl-D-alanine carboxypeptidase (penicillin-binding protein 5/6)
MTPHPRHLCRRKRPLNQPRFAEVKVLRSVITALSIGIAALVAVPASAPYAQVLDTPARNAYVVDLATDTVLLSKAADIPMPPASMSKLMTVFMVFDRLKKGSLNLDDTFLVSEKAWRKGGSKMFVKVGDRIKISDLLRGIIVQSGNDACIVVAEGLGGSEDAFAEMMTRRAKEIGLTNSRFANATGWPHPQHYMSARDLAVLSQRLVTDFPELYKIFAEKTFTYSKIKQRNRNPLLYREIGSDGLKTGHTEEAGYGLAASAARGDRRIVMVVNGLTSIRQRSQESLRMMEWAFRTFKPYALFKKDEVITKADIWLGDAPSVSLMIPEDLRLTLSRTARDKMKVTVKMNNPVAAPVRKGQKLATLVVSAPNFQTREIPLLAGEDVGQLGFVGRIGAAIKHVLWGSS